MTTNEELFTELGIGTRLRRLIDRMSPDVERLYAESGLTFKASWFYVIYALAERGPMPMGEIGALAGFTHSAVSQTVKKLMSLGLIDTETADDARQKLVRLTAKGEALVTRSRPIWAAVEASVKDVIAESGFDFLGAVTAMEDALKSKGLHARISEKLAEAAPPPFEIVPYDVAYRQAFYDLNAEWVRKWFVMEPVDEAVLSDPEGTILSKGGEVFFAVAAGKALGTVALKPMPKERYGEGAFELTKLGVSPEYRGGGMGKALCEETIRRFTARGGRLLFLETNTLLQPAIRLYEKLDFVAMEPLIPSPYERANYYMEWRGSPAFRGEKAA